MKNIGVRAVCVTEIKKRRRRQTKTRPRSGPVGHVARFDNELPIRYVVPEPFRLMMLEFVNSATPTTTTTLPDGG
jgi:hypothetical protein